MIAHQVANLAAPDRLTPTDIDTLMTELGGLTQILVEATPPEKASIYQGLGLHLVYRPDQNALVATGDLGRVLSRVGGRRSTPLRPADPAAGSTASPGPVPTRPLTCSRSTASEVPSGGPSRPALRSRPQPASGGRRSRPRDRARARQCRLSEAAARLGAWLYSPDPEIRATRREEWIAQLDDIKPLERPGQAGSMLWMGLRRSPYRLAAALASRRRARREAREASLLIRTAFSAGSPLRAGRRRPHVLRRDRGAKAP
jgi:hypothetical protein